MVINLLNYTPLVIAAQAIRQCWQSQDKSDSEGLSCGPNDMALIDRIGNQYKHSSTLEHIYYNFEINEVSRAVLQELARHRIASYSVKSTRYTLKELKNELPFTDTEVYGDKWAYSGGKDNLLWYDKPDIKRAANYLVFTGSIPVDQASIYALENLRGVLFVGISNDKAKYCLPEAYKTSLVWTINARALQNFLTLRSSKAALWEIRQLATNIFNTLPEDHKYLYTHCIDPKIHA